MAGILKTIVLILKYAVQIGPLVYEGGTWVIKIIREWRKVPAKKEPAVAPADEKPVDAKLDPG
jgi:hypothetical protein